MPISFEWDDTKAANNLRNHGVAFEHAAKACQDPFAVEWIDTRQDYGEERTALLGTYANTLLYVVYTERNDSIRIISARRATRHEQDTYYRRNTP